MVRSPCCSHQQMDLKKGPWTPDEDQKLLAYIQEHGHGSWRSLPSKAGLRRSGKSCRLRWTNYLRPDIKRGRFTLQEEQTIIQLHAFLGNRWSAIATHLPQRTDNEIKNYWNTHLKKRLTKMGIDPVTHKPKSHDVLTCNHPKDAANLSHIAQWESARLEAESKLVHRSSFVSNHYRSQLLNKTMSSTAPTGLEQPPRPPCLDILKVWQGPWTKLKNDNSSRTKVNGAPATNRSLESKISSGKMPTLVSSIEHSSYIDSPVGKPSNIYESNVMKGGLDNSAELHDVVEPSYSAYVYDSLRFPNFMDGYNYTGLPTSSNRTCEDFVASCSEDFEDNEINYWSNVLNVTTL